MKRIIASAGLAVVGAASVQAAYTPGLTPMEQSKPWSVSVAVRGFYDDNMFSAAKDADKVPGRAGPEESFGVSVKPKVGLNFALDRTVITFNYSYDFRWFEARTENEADHIQLADLGISHAFSERLKVDASDRFTYAQEGAVRIDDVQSLVGRSDGDYVHNRAKAGVTAGVTERLNLTVSYQNDIWDFENSGVNSFSALLDRMEHLGTVELGYSVTPATSAGIGYMYKDVSSRSSDMISTAAGLQPADSRNNRSHFIYGGVEHQFNAQLDAALRAGIQLVDFVNVGDNIANYDSSAEIPFVDASLGYAYNPGSSLRIGVKHTMAATSIGSALSQDATAVYANLNHAITPKWSLGAMALYQYSSLRGGFYDGDSEQLFVAGVNVNYAISTSLSAELGYNYDNLSSDLNTALDLRSYDRNRVYVGLRAAF